MLLDDGLVLYLSFDDGAPNTTTVSKVIDKSLCQNHGSVSGAILVKPYEDMSDDSGDEGDNPLVVIDDGGVAFWAVDDFGAGTVASSLSDDTSEQMYGANCLKNTVGAGGFARWGIAHVYGADQDWSAYDYISFWWYGDNSGNNVEIWIECPNGGNSWYYAFTVDFTGWQRIIIPLERFTVGAGAPDWTQMQAIRFYSAVNNWSPTFYLDRVILDVGNWRFGEAADFDGTNDIITVGDIGIIESFGFWIYYSSQSGSILELSNNTIYISISAGDISLTGFSNEEIYINGRRTSSLSTGWNFVFINFDAILADGVTIGEANGSYFDGLLDEIRAYILSLSPEEIRTLYLQSSRRG